ncbi:MAG: hypothetical protein GTO63_16865 [Anaerolineae bacterium]|nr:hypothetical protein [Anaerolineae bacterium]NIN96470.1 hypothetical protein [Anaerolineae bacterium]
MTMKMELSGLRRLTRKLRTTARVVPQEMVSLRDQEAERLLDLTIRNASGRPGPNIVTGDYVSSFYIKKSFLNFHVTNDSPQTHRLEYGFYGTDSLGRVYNQPPFPHMRPALQAVVPEYKKNLRGLVVQVWRES